MTNNYTPTYQLPDGLPRIQNAAKLGIPYAAWLLANRYLMGDGVEQDNAQAAHWMLRAARGGCPLAQRGFAWMIEQRLVSGPSSSEAVAWYHAAAHNADRKAQVILGEMYLYGKRVRADRSRALHYLNLAAQSRYLPAKRILAFIDAVGTPPPESAGAGVFKLLRQAQSGDGKAAYAVVLAFRDQWGISGASEEEQKSFLLKAVEAEVPNALCEHAFDLGPGPSDRFFTETGLELLNTAANRGSGLAMGFLAQHYSHLSIQEPDLARTYLRRALKSGFLGVHAFWADCGLGITTAQASPQLALHLALKSFKQGFSDAREIVSRMAYTQEEALSYDAFREYLITLAIYNSDHAVTNNLALQLLQRSREGRGGRKSVVKGSLAEADQIKGLFWLQAAIEDTNQDALLHLADELLAPESPSYDPASGLALLQSKAALGDANAAARVAYQLHHNRGLIRHASYASQVNHYAALKGSAMAMHNLSVSLMRGEGVKIDMEASEYWRLQALQTRMQEKSQSIELDGSSSRHQRRSQAKVLSLPMRKQRSPS